MCFLRKVQVLVIAVGKKIKRIWNKRTMKTIQSRQQRWNKISKME